MREIAYRESTGQATEAELKRFEQEIMPLYWHQGFQQRYLDEMYGTPLLNMDIGMYMMGTLSKGYDLRPQLPEMQTPALILQGRYDWVTPMAGAQAMASGLPNPTLHILEQSGHMGFIEQPDEVVASIKDWIQSVQ